MENQENKSANNMADMAFAIFDKITGLNAELNFDFDNLELQMPANNGGEASAPKWKLNGTLRIKTSGNKNKV